MNKAFMGKNDESKKVDNKNETFLLLFCAGREK
jgi:hypothetical protein